MDFLQVCILNVESMEFILIWFLCVYSDKTNGVTKQLNGMNIIKKVNNNKDKRGQLYEKWDSNNINL